MLAELSGLFFFSSIFLFVCLFIKKKKNCGGCREWSHVTDVGKMRIFHRIAGFILWWIVVYACDQNSSYILVIYFSLSLHFQVIIIVGAGRRVHHCNRWCKYIYVTLLSRANTEKKRLYSVAVVAGGSIHYQMQITVTHSADKSSLFSFFKHNNRHTNYVGGFFLLLNVVVSILFLRVSWFLPPLSIFFFFFSVLFQGIEF